MAGECADPGVEACDAIDSALGTGSVMAIELPFTVCVRRLAIRLLEQTVERSGAGMPGRWHPARRLRGRDAGRYGAGLGPAARRSRCHWPGAVRRILASAVPLGDRRCYVRRRRPEPLFRRRRRTALWQAYVGRHLGPRFDQTRAIPRCCYLPPKMRFVYENPKFSQGVLTVLSSPILEPAAS